MLIVPLSSGFANNPYVPWDPNYLYDAIAVLRGNIGTAFNIGLWIFLIILGITVVFAIVDRFGG